MNRAVVLLALAFSAGGCSRIINGSAPAKDPNTVYAAGAKQGFLWIWHPRVWVCSTDPARSEDCKMVEVDE